MATTPDHATVHEPGRDCTLVVPSTTSRGQHAGAVATLLDQTLHLVKGEYPCIMPTARSHTHLGVHDISSMSSQHEHGGALVASGSRVAGA